MIEIGQRIRVTKRSIDGYNDFFERLGTVVSIKESKFRNIETKIKVELDDDNNIRTFKLSEVERI